MSLSVDGTWKAGVWAQTVWHSGVWYEGAPPPTVTTNTSGAGRPKRGKYPRKAMVRGILYTVRSLEDELALLQTALLKAEYQEATAEISVKPVEAIRKRIVKVKSERDKWLQKLRQADEEILLLLH